VKAFLSAALVLLAGAWSVGSGQTIKPVTSPTVGDVVTLTLDYNPSRNESVTWVVESGAGELVKGASPVVASFKATRPGPVVIVCVIRDPNGERRPTLRFTVQDVPAVARPATQAAATAPVPPTRPARQAAGNQAAAGQAGAVDLDVVVDSAVPAGWMGDAMADNGEAATLDAGESTRCRTDSPCTRIEYLKPGKLGWAAFAWQRVPEGSMNWGEFPGVDLSERGFRSIRVWARGDAAAGPLPRVQFKSGGNVAAKFAATNAASYSVNGPTVALSNAYQEVCLDLSGRSLRNVVSPLTVVLTRAANPKGTVVILDDISFSTTPCTSR
jgi:hypothetical protein